MQEAGHNILCHHAPKEDPDKSEWNDVDITLKESNANTRVRKYGGGAVVFGKDESDICYSEFMTQCLCRLWGASRREIIFDMPMESCVNEVVLINVKDGSM